ncbi:uncharacterized protein LOC143260245 [Megalopta genalis]|uniref:uncharacterized protein LOC143260245 n=1 Tax=Megalopta genalis TaxID=115081 RepID=UPI003FD0FC3E
MPVPRQELGLGRRGETESPRRLRFWFRFRFRFRFRATRGGLSKLRGAATGTGTALNRVEAARAQVLGDCQTTPLATRAWNLVGNWGERFCVPAVSRARSFRSRRNKFVRAVCGRGGTRDSSLRPVTRRSRRARIRRSSRQTTVTRDGTVEFGANGETTGLSRPGRHLGIVASTLRDRERGSRFSVRIVRREIARPRGSSSGRHAKRSAVVATGARTPIKSPLHVAAGSRSSGCLEREHLRRGCHSVGRSAADATENADPCKVTSCGSWFFPFPFPSLPAGRGTIEVPKRVSRLSGSSERRAGRPGDCSKWAANHREKTRKPGGNPGRIRSNRRRDRCRVERSRFKRHGAIPAV